MRSILWPEAGDVKSTIRAVGARSEWSPGVLAGVFSGAAVRDCPALTERDLIAVTGRDVRAGCGLLVVERVVDRGARRNGCFLCFLSVRACDRCRQCFEGGAAWQW